MSISNLFIPNNYSLYGNEITAKNAFINGTVNCVTVDTGTINNGTQNNTITNTGTLNSTTIANQGTISTLNLGCTGTISTLNLGCTGTISTLNLGCTGTTTINQLSLNTNQTVSNVALSGALYGYTTTIKFYKLTDNIIILTMPYQLQNAFSGAYIIFPAGTIPVAYRPNHIRFQIICCVAGPNYVSVPLTISPDGSMSIPYIFTMGLTCGWEDVTIMYALNL